MDILKELETLNREITTATREMDQAEGRKTVMIETLKKEFGISPKQVDNTLKKLDKQLAEVSGEIETKFKELQEEYAW